MNLIYGINNTGELRTAIQIQGLQMVSLASTEELSYSLPAALPYRALDMTSRQVSGELLTHTHTRPNTHSHARTHTHTRARTHTHTHIHTHLHTYTETHPYTCIHLHTY